MDTKPKFRCSTCRSQKPSNQFGTRQRGGVHGQPGGRLNVCLSCTATNFENRKRKRLESNSAPPAKRFAVPPAISPCQFMETLAEYASYPKIEVSLRVSLAGMTLSGKDVADHIASLAWKATGFRFTYVASSTLAHRLWWLIKLPCIASIFRKCLRMVYHDFTIYVVKPAEL